MIDRSRPSFVGKTVLISGGSRGIGRATAIAFARLGAGVAINYITNREAAEETVAAIRDIGPRAIAIPGDIGIPSDASRVIESVLESFGSIDCLVCNAGLWEGALVEAMTEESWDRVVDTNLKGTWALCRAAVPAMKRQRSGRIVIVSSTAGQRGEAGYSNYAAAKGGQLSFTKALAAELAAFGINVNAVAPGWVDTEMTVEVMSDSNRRLAIEESIPLGRIAEADDVAWPIVFLASDWAAHITGEVLNINGGSVLCG
jgi:3-oxoacyl-[acyl-carrier protein] reductase